MSLMEDVRGRLEWARFATSSEELCELRLSERSVLPARVSQLLQPPSPRRCGGLPGLGTAPFYPSTCSDSPCPSELAAAAAFMAPVFPDGLDDGSEAVWPRCTVSFRTLMVSANIFFVLLTCTLMYITLEVSSTTISGGVIRSCHQAMDAQQATVDELVYQNVAQGSFRNLVRSCGAMVEEMIRLPTSRAAEALWGSTRTLRRFDPSWRAGGEERQAQLAYRSWAELDRQWNMSAPGWGTARSASCGLPRYFAAESVSVHFLNGESAGCQVAPRDVRCPAAGLGICGDCVGWCTWLSLETFSSGPAVNGSTTSSYWATSPATGSLLNSIRSVRRRLGQESPGLAAQRRRAALAAASEQSASLPLQPLWSKLHMLDGAMRLSWTLPLAPCGDYSCLEGAVEAGVTLRQVSRECAREWARMTKLLASPAYNFRIANENSSLFIVQHFVDAFPEDRGLLVGTSDAYPVNSRVLAEDAPQRVVRDAARALLATFGAWNATELVQQEQLFAFRKGRGGREFEKCDPTSQDERAQGCQQVATLSVRLDEHTRWLVVASLPAGAFNGPAETSVRVAKEAVALLRTHAQRQLQRARMAAAIVVVLIAAAGAALGAGLACMAAKQLRRLSEFMRQVGDLDFSERAGELGALYRGQLQCFSDVIELQEAFCRLVRVIEAFTRFVPEPVVTRIVRGDRRATRLHVDARDVTVMFCGIADFTRTTESLSEGDLVTLLTAYHTVMTKLMEDYEGVVAEILDDGLLVYWNAPDNVPDHASKACEAALAHQCAMELLNCELESRGLPQLAVHIGLHTGPVLAGNIGSSKKMKFGCMGDTVNLTSRLNGLCKFYGVRVVCSGATRRALPPGSGLVCRQLDLVKVKGRREPTAIFEVAGRFEGGEEQEEEDDVESQGTRDSGAEGDGEEALQEHRPGTPTRPTVAMEGRTMRAMDRNPLVQGNSRSSSSSCHPDSTTIGKRADVAGVPSEGGGGLGIAADAGAGALGIGAASPPNAGGVASTSAASSSPLDVGNALSHGHSMVLSIAAELRAAGHGLDEEESERGLEEPDSDCESQRAEQERGRRRWRSAYGSRAFGYLPSLLAHRSSLRSRRSFTLPDKIRSGSTLKSDSRTPLDVVIGRSQSAIERQESASSAATLTSIDCRRARRYEEALRCFQEARFDRSRRILEALLREQPDNTAAQLLLERVACFTGRSASRQLSQDELAAWTGVTNMTDK